MLRQLVRELLRGALPPDRLEPLPADGCNALFGLAKSCIGTGNIIEARQHLQKILVLSPGHGDSLYELGCLAAREGQADEAKEWFAQAISANPGAARYHNSYGNLLYAGGKLEEAAELYRKALRVDPDFAEAHANMGMVLCETGKTEAGLAFLRKAIAIDPRLYEAHNSLGIVLVSQGDMDNAVAALSRAIELKPDFAEAHNNLGGALGHMGRLEDAITSFRRALESKPDFVEAHSSLVFSLNYLADCAPEEIFREHLEWARRHAAPLKPAIRPHHNLRAPDRRLRVGYVSAYFGNHAVSYFFEPTLMHHDTSRFEVFCYSDVRQPDAYTHRMRSYPCVWRDIAGQSDEAVAQLIASDEIDILVDLSGHIAEHRLLVFARKPAPVQVTWNGYPNTTGMEAMDYRITDAYADPPGMTEHLHTEQLVRLPEIYMAYQPPEISLPVRPPPSLANGYVTFGSFNKLSKITPQVIAVWAQILKALPAARLLILTVPEGGTGARLEQAFAEHGVGAERLELLGRLPVQQFLAAHQRADVALDPFPYNGTTTTCQTLWMGVPLVTLAGRSHVARVGVSMLSNLGLERFIARDAREYVSIAVALATDHQALATLRAGLRERMLSSPNTDGARLTRFLEAAYAKMWKDYCLRTDS